MIFHNQLRLASEIVTAYQGEMPLAAWLKDYFRVHKQMGSRDRKLLSNLVYGYYRLGHSLRSCSIEDRLLAGLFLCNDKPSAMLDFFRPEWDRAIQLSIPEKISLCQASGIDFHPEEIFPWKEELSEGIDHLGFCLSFLSQPSLFLRIRPGWEQMVIARLTAQKAEFEFLPPFTVRLPNGFKAEELFTPDKEVVIQDYSSQRVAGFLRPALEGEISGGTEDTGDAASGRQLAVWDACAASGGKSLLAYDLAPTIRLTVSDIRDSILINLRNRFNQAGIKGYHHFVADLSKMGQSGADRGKTGTNAGRIAPSGVPGNYDLIIVDAPCSGSGTWGRTPEELYFFRPGKIDHYAALQKKIVAGVVSHLKDKANLLYITCSVFKKENEMAAAFIRDEGLKASPKGGQVAVIPGYALKADTMFAALFSKNGSV